MERGSQQGETPDDVPVTPDKIDQYFAGQCSGAETVRIRAYLAERPGLERYHRALYSALDGDALITIDPARSYAVLNCQLSLDSVVVPPSYGNQRPGTAVIRKAIHPRGPLSVRAPRQSAAYVLASLAVCAVGAVGWYAASSWRGESPPGAVTTYTTGNGERANIMLPDGSTAMLNVGSRLDVPADYARGNHALRLTGEALFTVAHGAKHPFTVTSGSATARVLGTSFVVRHYEGDTATTVAVRDGKVAIRSVVLAAGEQSDIGRTTATRPRQLDPSRFTFAAGVLTLRAMPLCDAIVEWNRWYDMDIRLGDSRIARRTIYGEFAAGAPQDLIAVLEATPHVRLVRDGRVLTLYTSDDE